MLLRSRRVAASRVLRQLATLLDQQSTEGARCGVAIADRASSASASSTSSTSTSRLHRFLFTNSPSSSSGSIGGSIGGGHPTEDAEPHASVPEGATLAEEEEGSPPTPKRNSKKATPSSLPSLDPLRTADALWPQSTAQRRVGQRVHRALQAILSRPRSSTLPESVSQRLLGAGECGLALAGARASPDGRSVFVLYDCSAGAEEEARNALRAAAGPLRSAVSRVAGFKKVPKLVFVRDGEGGGGRRERGEGAASGDGSVLPGRRRERSSGGSVDEIEAEMARLGLLGGEAGEAGEEGQREEEESSEGESEEGDKGSRP